MSPHGGLHWPQKKAAGTPTREPLIIHLEESVSLPLVPPSPSCLQVIFLALTLQPLGVGRVMSPQTHVYLEPQKVTLFGARGFADGIS